MKHTSCPVCFGAAAQSAGKGGGAGVRCPRLPRVDGVHVEEAAQAQPPASTRRECGRLQRHRDGHRRRGKHPAESQRGELRATYPLAQGAGVRQRYQILQPGIYPASCPTASLYLMSAPSHTQARAARVSARDTLRSRAMISQVDTLHQTSYLRGVMHAAPC